MQLNAQSLGGGVGGGLGGQGLGGQGGGGQGGGFGGGGQGGFGGGGGQFNVAPPSLPKGLLKQKPVKAAVQKKIADPELDGLLDGILNDASIQKPAFKGFAQVKPFRFDGETLKELKKKP